ncbi:protein-lysine methyltransferase C42C1.13-like isoform X1 [Histomonas meleagridis]|uniref:protein-lysine methyltransferase C42C1.13-like isoform X1 n=1 Tax=Histomonas meleagridis TaxID=135588 RepID=UPI00355AC013|nr:protein-lysine methyltransferase C42C1.13-like isoform X1 [Histomonas meleagridis]KAH0805165.1 protein-lysine methyltransferase C42C1.13-like isoform X1 [Histomonas meleagridis]
MSDCEEEELFNGNDMYELFFDREYVKQECNLPSGREMSFLALKTSMTDADLTGQILWPGCTLLITWLDYNMSIFDNKSVVEVGAGTGVCASFIAKYSSPTKVIATDGSEPVMELIQNNIDLYKDRKNITCELLKWNKESREPFAKKHGQFDFVIGSEIAYNENCVEDLVDTMNLLLKPNGRFVIGHIDRYTQTTRALYRKLEESGFVKESEFPWDSLLNYKMELIVGSVIVFKRKDDTTEITYKP